MAYHNCILCGPLAFRKPDIGMFEEAVFDLFEISFGQDRGWVKVLGVAEYD